MSANQSESTQPHQMHPNSLANLRTAPAWEKGQSGNPGGFPQSVRYDIAYKRLSAMSDEEFAAYVPKNKAERVARARILCAESEGKGNGEQAAANKAAEICADRVDGKLERTINKNSTSIEIKYSVAVAESVEAASKLGLSIDPERAAMLLELIAGAREEAE